MTLTLTALRPIRSGRCSTIILLCRPFDLFTLCIDLSCQSVQYKYSPESSNNITIINMHSFIHYVGLYSTSSRLPLKSTPDPSTAKKSSFKARVECVGANPGEKSQCQWKPIPNRGANDQQCTSLVS